jgi:hypothetical protein
MNQQLASSLGVILSFRHPGRTTTYSVRGALTVPRRQRSLGSSANSFLTFSGSIRVPNLPPAQPQHVHELIEYAPGSVVSRTVIKRPVGTVTLFSFDEGRVSRRDLCEPLKATGCSVHLVGGAETAAELDAQFAIDQACRLARPDLVIQ